MPKKARKRVTKSAKQKTAQAKFKKMIARAKTIKKQNPGKKWTSCIKQAAK
jgi:soluble cytochrome b562